MDLKTLLAPEKLNQFIGTEKYIRHWGASNVVMTDGIGYCIQNGLAWFIDIVAISQSIPEVWKETFQSWTLARTDSNGWLVKATDGGKGEGLPNTLYTQNISMTDYPFDRFTCYVEETLLGTPEHYKATKVILLPSED